MTRQPTQLEPSLRPPGPGPEQNQPSPPARQTAAERVIETITSREDAVRNRTLEELLEGRSFRELLGLAGELEAFLKSCENLYRRVRTCLFLFAIYRFYLPAARSSFSPGLIPRAAARQMLNRNWAAAVRLLRGPLRAGAPDAVMSALAEAYYRMAFGYLLEQVHHSIRRAPGNEWIFNLTSPDNYPLRVPAEYALADHETGLYPLGNDRCPVRIDPCHSGWSDIFYLAMDFPEGARVINFSVDIARRGTGPPRPPIECYSRVIDRAAIRLVSLDLGISRNITTTGELFNFDLDQLGLLKAGVIAAGIVPPAFRDNKLAVLKVLRKLVGRGRGIELITRVRDLPRGSRMAVSTTLLATIITRLMRMTGQFASPEGELTDDQRRIVASRAILGEWLGGSGGGWQDSGGLWPGIKIIEGVRTGPGDPEDGISRGRLLPDYRVIPAQELPDGIDRILREAIVLVHGGLARDVGPILELVTDKYLLRYRKEWEARLREAGYFDGITRAIRLGEMKELGRLTSEDWEEGTKKIIPGATDGYTEELIARVKERWGDDFWGFLMLGGQAGGGMAFIVNPEIRREFAAEMEELMPEVKNQYRRALPFAREPAVFDFALNHHGIRGEFRRGGTALPPAEYYRFCLSDPAFSRERKRRIPGEAEIALARQRYSLPEPAPPVNETGKGGGGTDRTGRATTSREGEFGFDRSLHRRNKELYQAGKIGLLQNRISQETIIEDVGPDEITPVPGDRDPEYRRCRRRGEEALRRGEAAVVTFGAGLGSRWSAGAAVVKLLNPFLMMKGRHRSFLEIHLAKSARTGREYGRPIQHAITTSFLTHDPIADALAGNGQFGFPGTIYLSPSRSVIRRLYPTEADLREFWKPRLRSIRDPERRKDERRRRDRLIRRSQWMGPGEEYDLEPPLRRFYPAGHWYEIPNLIRNGTLGKMLEENPGLNYLLVHNTDTLGAALDPAILGLHIRGEGALSFEILPRLWGDRGGYLARVDGDIRILEAGTLPGEEAAFGFTYYNSLTTWISIDRLLRYLWLTREDLRRAGSDPEVRERVEEAIRAVEKDIPVYVTLKEAETIRGGGRRETVPVVQCERLWGDMSGLPLLESRYIAVDRHRGRQLKDPGELDNWIRDGALNFLEELAVFSGPG